MYITCYVYCKYDLYHYLFWYYLTIKWCQNFCFVSWMKETTYIMNPSKSTITKDVFMFVKYRSKVTQSKQ